MDWRHPWTVSRSVREIVMAKPPFPWIGSKEKLAPYILPAFPPKLRQYVEPFGGSGAVLLALPPDPNRLDIYNDLDSELVNLFSCIKERIIRDIQLSEEIFK